GLLVGEQQRRHHTPALQPVTPGQARHRLDPVAEVTQALHVPSHRTLRHTEPFRQLGPRPVAVRLKQVEEGERTCGGVRHTASLPPNQEPTRPRLWYQWRSHSLEAGDVHPASRGTDPAPAADPRAKLHSVLAEISEIMTSARLEAIGE